MRELAPELLHLAHQRLGALALRVHRRLPRPQLRVHLLAHAVHLRALLLRDAVEILERAALLRLHVG